MPKGSPRKADAKRVRGAYLVTDSKGSHLITGREKARALVGDQGLAKTDEAYEQGTMKTAYSSDKQLTPSEKKAKAAKMKATVDSAMDEAIEMVRKKKSTKRSGYQ